MRSFFLYFSGLFFMQGVGGGIGKGTTSPIKPNGLISILSCVCWFVCFFLSQKNEKNFRSFFFCYGTDPIGWEIIKYLSPLIS